LTVLYSLHRLVEFRIEKLPDRIDLFDTSTFEGIPELFGDHLDALLEGATVVLRMLKGTLEVVEHRQKIAHDLLDSRKPGFLAFPLHPLTKIVELCQLSKIDISYMIELRLEMCCLIFDFRRRHRFEALGLRLDLHALDLLVEEFVLEGPTMGIAGQGSLDLVDKQADVTLLLAPLRTVDFIMEKTPVVSNITGGKLVTVPVRIKGDWEDPQVTMLSAASVGQRLLGMMRNTLMLPVDIMEPVIPGDHEQKDSPP